MMFLVPMQYLSLLNRVVLIKVEAEIELATRFDLYLGPDNT